MSSRVGVAAVVAVAASLSTAVPAARAAIYEVHACRLPSGAAAPDYGWSATTAAVSNLNCPGGTMTIRPPGGAISPGWRYGLFFTAPPGTNIAGFRRHVVGQVVQVPGGPPPWHWDYAEAGIVVGEEQLQDIRVSGNMGPLDDSFEYPLARRLSQLQFSLQCSEYQNTAPCQDNGSYFSLRQIAVKLDDYTPPRVLSISGSLLTPTSPQLGQRHLILKLRDAGSGLYQVRVDVDGERMTEQPIDSNDGACKRPFVVPVPCKLTATVDVAIDTTKLSEGVHAITVRAFDATGVNAAVVGPVSVLVDNLPDPPARGTAACPTHATATVERRLKTKAVRFGQSASVVGRVVAPRAALKGARMGIVDNPWVDGRPPLVRVDRGGRFRLKLHAQRSTRVQPILVSASGEAQACGKPLNLGVRAGVRLTAGPRHLRNGQSIRLQGHVSRAAIPALGKTIAIQARAHGAAAWTTVTLIRSDSAGYFRFAYRFRRTFRTTTYEFRALAPREHGYPYLRGWSRLRQATVSP